MTDTPPAIAAKMEDMLRQKTPVERLLMGCSMFDLSKRLVKLSISRMNPTVAPARLQWEVFLRFYGHEFSPASRKKIHRHFTQQDAKCS